MSKQTVNIRITVKATTRQIEWLKEYTRDLGVKGGFRAFLEEAVLDELPSQREILEMERR